MKVYVGTSGYAYDEWKGTFYPEKIPSKKMLGFYSERLNSVEINNTFYRMPTRNLVKSWAEQVPDGFLFAVKAPQMITHIKQLENVRDETEFFFGALSGLGSKIGAVLFQFSRTFEVNNLVLEEFLSLIPEDVACAFAFRNPSMLTNETLSLLSKYRCSLCLEDTDERPIGEIISTTSWCYLRLRRSEYTKGDLKQWAEIILKQDWERAFIYFKHENEVSPSVAMRSRVIMEAR